MKKMKFCRIIVDTFTNETKDRSKMCLKIISLLLLFSSFSVFATANSNLLSGKVVDKNGEPVIGASILNKESKAGTITDINGDFSLKDLSVGAIIEVTYIGYKPQSIKYTGQNFLNIILEEDSEILDDVVVIGYGTMKKSDLTSSISSVKNDVISSASTSNIGDILQGKVPGLNIGTSRYEGDNQSILIRGERSMKAGNAPLVIVDGVTGDMNTLSPNDIESIEILKDAASAAIYGSRGANGVIIVTTKKGKSGKTSISYNAYYGFKKAEMINMMPGEKFAQLKRDAYLITNNKWGQDVPDSEIFNEGELGIIKSRNYVDWFDLMFRDGSTQSHNISLSSGTEKTKIHLSFTYEDEKGYARTDNTKKYYLTMSIDHAVAKWMDIGTSVKLRKRNNSGFLKLGQELQYGSPIVAPYDENGNLIEFPNRNETFLNLLYNYEPGQYVNDSQNLNTNLLFYSDIHPLPYLRMRTNFGYTLNNNINGHFYGDKSLPTAGGYKESGRDGSNDYSWTLNNTITFEEKFFEHHHVTVDGITELYKSKGDTWSAKGQNQDIDNLSYYNLETNRENKNITSGASDAALASFMGRLRYDYQGKYLLNFSLRTDGSSKLAKGNKWAAFPSGGMAWRISSEKFMESLRWLDDLKLRVSYGVVGNQAVDSYNSLELLGTYKYMFGNNGFYAYRPGSLSNKSLTWEKTKTANIGVDFTLFSSWLSGSVEYYKTRTTDLLMERSLPLTVGYSKILENVGETENNGFETTINATIVNTKDLKIDMYGNFSTNRNKIVKLNSPNDDITNGWFIGKPIGVIYEYEKAGIWQLGEEAEAAKYGREPGEVKIKDYKNEEGKVGIGPEDKVFQGQRQPKHLASLGLNIKWKDFDFSMNLNSKWGYKIYHGSSGGSLILNGNRWVADVDYWTPDNPTNKYPRAHVTWPTDVGLCGWMKGDHIRVQDITLGYDFAKLLKDIHISKARLYVQGRNLGYLYRAASEDIHPESTEMYLTIPTTFIVGLNINF